MPTYDYECDACGHRFELYQSITEDPKKKCPQCKKSRLRRLFGTGAAVMFKGSGFYQTDYRSEAYKKASEAEKKSSSGDSTSTTKSESSGKSETKSEAKSEPKPENTSRAKRKGKDRH
jgi:putative FmdB family regulatory protein